MKNDDLNSFLLKIAIENRRCLS